MEFASNNIKFHGISVLDDNATITVTVPCALLPTFKVLMDSLFSFASYVHQKHRHAVAASSDSYREFSDNRSRVVFERIKAEFEKHYTGANFRQAVSFTKKALVAAGYPVTCGLIEEYLRQWGHK